MKNLQLIALFAVFALVGAGASIYLNLHENPSSSSQSADNLNEVAQPKATIENGSVINHVFLYQTGALPDAMAVKLGEFVQFDTRDSKQHSIAQGGGDEFNQTHSHQEFGVESRRFGPGEAYRVGFTRTGTYHFHDHYNSKIFVTVIVYKPESNSTDSSINSTENATALSNSTNSSS